MTNDLSNKGKPGGSGPESDHYSGMVDIDFALTPSVIICAAAGAVLGLMLAMWGVSDPPIIIATTIVMGVLSGIFGMFVPWYKPQRRDR